MLRRRLAVRLLRPEDALRRELFGYIKESQHVPRVHKAGAMLAVQMMKPEELQRVCEVARQLIPLVDAGDIEGLRARLNDLGLPVDLQERAERILTDGYQRNHDHPAEP